MRYIYGPIESRRLGLSLGVSLTPYKICNFNCVYCQLGKTIELQGQRQEYVKIAQVFDELKNWLLYNAEEGKSLDYITLSGAGEPTLNVRINDVIVQIKKFMPFKIAVITNASLLKEQEVRKALSQADLIIPTLDAVTQELFKKINRPKEGINIEDIIEGLVSLRKEFIGKIWLEVMLVSGLNDDLRHIRRLKGVIEEINPDKVHLNSPVRSTSEEGILAVEEAKLRKIKEILGDKCEVI
jgi:wyosine [tRNA(Phe)-imidazoG37] synthetase (radical SAM superfamily)